jgi:hypothetical protein
LLANILNNLSTVYRTGREDGRAEKYQRRALDILEQKLGVSMRKWPRALRI